MAKNRKQNQYTPPEDLNDATKQLLVDIFGSQHTNPIARIAGRKVRHIVVNSTPNQEE